MGAYPVELQLVGFRAQPAGLVRFKQAESPEYTYVIVRADDPRWLQYDAARLTVQDPWPCGLARGLQRRPTGPAWLGFASASDPATTESCIEVWRTPIALSPAPLKFRLPVSRLTAWMDVPSA